MSFALSQDQATGERDAAKEPRSRISAKAGEILRGGKPVPGVLTTVTAVK